MARGASILRAALFVGLCASPRSILFPDAGLGRQIAPLITHGYSPMRPAMHGTGNRDSPSTRQGPTVTDGYISYRSSGRTRGRVGRRDDWRGSNTRGTAHPAAVCPVGLDDALHMLRHGRHPRLRQPSIKPSEQRVRATHRTSNLVGLLAVVDVAPVHPHPARLAGSHQI